MMEAVSTSETSVYFYEIIRRPIPEGCNVLTFSSFGDATRQQTDTTSPLRVHYVHSLSISGTPDCSVRRRLGTRGLTILPAFPHQVHLTLVSKLFASRV
jgi:hypothetical protein